jgi:hypothetical protein
MLTYKTQTYEKVHLYIGNSFDKYYSHWRYFQSNALAGRRHNATFQPGAVCFMLHASGYY